MTLVNLPKLQNQDWGFQILRLVWGFEIAPVERSKIEKLKVCFSLIIVERNYGIMRQTKPGLIDEYVIDY